MDRIIDYLAEELKEEAKRKAEKRQAKRARFQALLHDIKNVQPQPMSLDFLAMGD